MNLTPRIQYTAISLIAALAVINVNAASLMLDFGQTNVAAPYLTLSPAHNASAIPVTDVSWNKIAVSTPNSSLVRSDGSAAPGVTLNLGQEVTGGNNIINYSTAIGNLNLAGTGGAVSGKTNLLGPGSIYGNDASSTAVGRDGIFGGGAATTTGAAIGLRLDGLDPGDYLLYIMARNVNSDATSYPMNIFATTGLSSGTFDFSTLTAHPESNIGYDAVGYANQYNTFVDGENFVGLNLTLGAGESLFLAIDGGNDAVDRRGFINSLQIVPVVPEPGTAALFFMSFGALLIVARKRKGA
jgi:hypothetical protein